MISNQVLQSTLDGLKAISRVDLCVMDTEGILLASTFDGADHFRESVLSFVNSPADSQVISGYQFFKVLDENQLEYILIANGNTDDVYMVSKMAAFQLQGLLVAYRERFDKDNFIKNLLLDNLLLVDIYNRAKKLHVEADARRAVFIMEVTHEKESSCLELVRGLFSGKNGDFITAVDERSIILVKDLKDNEGYEELQSVARTILDMLNSEAMEVANIAYGTIIDKISGSPQGSGIHVGVCKGICIRNDPAKQSTADALCKRKTKLRQNIFQNFTGSRAFRNDPV